MQTICRYYNRPVHAVRIFDRELSRQAALGRSLHSLSQVYSIGTGIRLRFEFVDTPSITPCRLEYRLGRLRDEAAVTSSGWQLSCALPMKAAWVTIGYFYLLKQRK